jgi:hypothetical protein
MAAYVGDAAGRHAAAIQGNSRGLKKEVFSAASNLPWVLLVIINAGKRAFLALKHANWSPLCDG